MCLRCGSRDPARAADERIQALIRRVHDEEDAALEQLRAVGPERLRKGRARQMDETAGELAFGGARTDSVAVVRPSELEVADARREALDRSHAVRVRDVSWTASSRNLR